MKFLAPFILTAITLSMTNFVFAQDYQARASTCDEAFQDLSAQMRVTIKNEVATKTTEKKWGWFSLATQNNSVKQSVSSNIDIIGATVDKQEDQTCVSLT